MLFRMWDTRKLQSLAVGTLDNAAPLTPPPSSPPGGPTASSPRLEVDLDLDTITEFSNSKPGKGCLRASAQHTKSVSSAYWDPRGRSIVSTSYDDKLRCGLSLSLMWLTCNVYFLWTGA
jgi:hypothetical protein